VTPGTSEASHSEGGRSRARWVRAYVGLGSNVGPSEATLAAAVSALAALPGVRLRNVSPLYATAPVGMTEQPEFRNAVVALDVPAGPEAASGALALLVALKAIERSFGRRERERWGPRELDLDLLVFGRWGGTAVRPADARSDDPAKRDLPLTVPHPEARRRLFVLAPLADLAPGLVPPGWRETVASAARRRRAVEGEGAVRRIGDWTGAGWTSPA